jgi:two-component system CheB/CheR fusion protein
VGPETFLQVADLLPDATLLVAGDGTILAANRAAARRLAMTADELCARPLAALVADGASCLTQYLRECAASRELVQAALVFGGRPGQSVPCHCEGAALEIGTAQAETTILLRVLPHGTDMESELRRRAAESAEADRHKEDFLAMLAHELRNPLAPALNALHLLGSRNAEATAHERAWKILDRQIRHLNRLVNELLDVSRLTRGKIKLQPGRMDLGRVVRRSVEDHQDDLQRAGLTCEVETPQTPVWMRGDATRLSQVVANLLDNVIKFTDPGGRATVRVTVDEPRSLAVLRVRDTGIGIDAPMLRRLFQVFAQADRSLDRPRGGLGLGLAVVKGLVNLHGGDVAVTSSGPRQGTEVTVRLPLVGEPAALTEAPTTASPTMSPCRVLVVEDNRDSADSLRMLLEMMGHPVRVARTGTEGVQVATDWLPEAVICDIGLPEMNGYEVARRLRQQAGMEQALLVALTGYNLEEDRRQSRDAGFDHHLVKPADPEVLRGLLKRRAG